MIAFDEIQDKAAEMIRAVAFFDSWSVIVDDGFQRNNIEKALDDAGAVVVVGLPYDSVTEMRQPGVNLTLVDLPVMFMVRAQGTDGAFDSGVKVNLTSALRAGIAAVLSYSQSDDSDRFILQDKPIQLQPDDAGLLTYVAGFRKLTTFNDQPTNTGEE